MPIEGVGAILYVYKSYTFTYYHIVCDNVGIPASNKIP